MIPFLLVALQVPLASCDTTGLPCPWLTQGLSSRPWLSRGSSTALRAMRLLLRELGSHVPASWGDLVCCVTTVPLPSAESVNSVCLFLFFLYFFFFFYSAASFICSSGLLEAGSAAPNAFKV